MIKITNLEKFYRTEEVETIALNKLTMQVDTGEFVAIMGPSGCGKSTLLKHSGDAWMIRMKAVTYLTA
jgi:putative ABC transport system ATP-binding protein